MKKKIIAFILLFFISFSIGSGLFQKKSEAVTIAGAYLGIKTIIGILAGGSALLAGGYYIKDNLDTQEERNEFVNWMREILPQIKPGEPSPTPPPPEPLDPFTSAALQGLLTQQGITIGSDLYQQIYDYYNNLNEEILIPKSDQINNVFNFTGTNITRSTHGAPIERVNWYDGAISYNQYNWVNYSGTKWITELQYQGVTFGYEELTLIPTGQNTGYTIYLNNVKRRIIGINNEVLADADPYWLVSGFNTKVNSVISGLLTGSYGTTSNLLNFSIDLSDIFQGSSPNLPSTIQQPEIMIDPMEWQDKFQGIDMSPLSGLVKNPQELIDIVNGNKQVTPQKYEDIVKAFNEVLANYLKNPNGEGLPEEPVPPVTNPTTGNLDFADLPEGPILDPESPPDNLTFFEKAIYWLKGLWYAITNLPNAIWKAFEGAWQWYKVAVKEFWDMVTGFLEQFWQNLKEVIDEYWMILESWVNDFWIRIQGFFDNIWSNLELWWQNVVLPSLETLLQTITDPIVDIYNWLKTLPNQLLELFIPPDFSIEDEVFGPIKTRFWWKFQPFLLPLIAAVDAGFYETELQDVKININTPFYSDEVTVISYKALKDSRDMIKWVIRAFFWILVVFFNIDQLHRLIRNQGLIKSYVHRLEASGHQEQPTITFLHDSNKFK